MPRELNADCGHCCCHCRGCLAGNKADVERGSSSIFENRTTHLRGNVQKFTNYMITAGSNGGAKLIKLVNKGPGIMDTSDYIALLFANNYGLHCTGFFFLSSTSWLWKLSLSSTSCVWACRYTW